MFKSSNQYSNIKLPRHHQHYNDNRHKFTTSRRLVTTNVNQYRNSSKCRRNNNVNYSIQALDTSLHSTISSCRHHSTINSCHRHSTINSIFRNMLFNRILRNIIILLNHNFLVHNCHK